MNDGWELLHQLSSPRVPAGIGTAPAARRSLPVTPASPAAPTLRHSPARGHPLPPCPSTAAWPHTAAPPEAAAYEPSPSQRPLIPRGQKAHRAASAQSGFPTEKLAFSWYFDMTKEITWKICNFPLTGVEKPQANPARGCTSCITSIPLHHLSEITCVPPAISRFRGIQKTG